MHLSVFQSCSPRTLLDLVSMGAHGYVCCNLVAADIAAYRHFLVSAVAVVKLIAGEEGRVRDGSGWYYA
jgi:hypothetical protein